MTREVADLLARPGKRSLTVSVPGLCSSARTHRLADLPERSVMKAREIMSDGVEFVKTDATVLDAARY